MFNPERGGNNSSENLKQKKIETLQKNIETETSTRRILQSTLAMAPYTSRSEIIRSLVRVENKITSLQKELDQLTNQGGYKQEFLAGTKENPIKFEGDIVLGDITMDGNGITYNETEREDKPRDKKASETVWVDNNTNNINSTPVINNIFSDLDYLDDIDAIDDVDEASSVSSSNQSIFKGVTAGGKISIGNVSVSNNNPSGRIEVANVKHMKSFKTVIGDFEFTASDSSADLNDIEVKEVNPNNFNLATQGNISLKEVPAGKILTIAKEATGEIRINKLSGILMVDFGCQARIIVESGKGMAMGEARNLTMNGENM
jgi:hypothetical protein